MHGTRRHTPGAPAGPPASPRPALLADAVQTATSTGAAAAAHALVERWGRRLAGKGLRVGLADGEDARCVQAALRLHRQGLIAPVLIGRPVEVDRAARSVGSALPSDLPVVDSALGARNEEYVDTLANLLAHKAPTREQILKLATDPVWVAALMVRLGQVEAAVAGSSRPTADVVRAGLRVVGLAAGARVVSSCFLMALESGRTVGYGDCAVLPMPSEDQLADVAISTAATYTELTGERPLVAMLSFSTKGSASHESVDRVRRAVDLVHRRAPGLAVDGELQFDAAYVPAVADTKAPRSSVAGRANVFIFPDLQAGNIAYKITERVGGAVALGPVLQGLAAPLNDLSRGCSVNDIATMALIGAAQAAEHVSRDDAQRIEERAEQGGGGGTMTGRS